MGHRRWATTPQSAWLKERFPQFRVAQNEGKTGEFMSSTAQEYFDTFFPGVVVPKKVLEEVAKAQKGNENATIGVVAVGEDGTQVDLLTRAKVRWWFYNRRIGKGRGKGGEDSLFNFTPKKAPKPQLYQTKQLTEVEVGADEQHTGDAGDKDDSEGDAGNKDEWAGAGDKDERDAGDKDEREADSKKVGENATPRKWLSFAIEVAIEFVEKASDEEKAAVEEHRAKHGVEHSGLELFGGLQVEGSPDSPATSADAQELRTRATAIQLAINDLPKVLQNVLDEIERKTGWVGTFMVGGPAPDTGKLMAMITHQGRTLNLGHNFGEATDKWRPVEEAFNKFLTSCYAPDARKKLTDAYHGRIDATAPTQLPSAADPSTTTSPASATLQRKSSDPLNHRSSSSSPADVGLPSNTSTTQGATAVNTATKKVGPSKVTDADAGEESESESQEEEESYDDFVERQRAKAHARMVELGLQQAATAMNEEMAAAAGRQKKRTPRAKNDPTKKPAGTRPQTRSATTAANTPTVTSTPGSQSATPAVTTASPAPAPVAASLNPGASTSSQSTDSGVSTPDSATAATFPSAAAAAERSIDARIPDPISTLSPTSIGSDRSPAAPQASAATALSEQAAGQAFDPTRSIGSQPQAFQGIPTTRAAAPPSSPNPPAQPLSVVTPVSANANANAPGPVPLVHETGQALVSTRGGASGTSQASTSPPSNPSAVSGKDAFSVPFNLFDADAPPYVKDALQYFKLIEGGGSVFAELVEYWQVFEASRAYPSGNKPDQRLPTRLRPPEIREWMQVGRSYENLPCITPRVFGQAWKDWWTSLQPSSRVDGDTPWPLLRVEPVDCAEWDVLWRAGPNGFFLVVLSLAWWLWAVSENEEEEAEGGMTLEEVKEAVSDVLWVFRLALASSVGGQKRPGDALDESATPNKRTRVE
ncbi:transporter [Ganoderma sinense ZZ0214-1]|uniref:Transporter n=1 Tax=Ganoderma sinense ZZ0214-1 TaxID=1077348 RepID=A0A2G8S6F8_9APHY|nr:transporter [Ganoderma sinense ZZ0214-1]